MQKYLVAVFAACILATCLTSFAEAHPHNSINLMQSHSHDIHDAKFIESFFIHTFEHVIISVTDLLSFVH